jgi:cobalamin transport system permease protein
VLQGIRTSRDKYVAWVFACAAAILLISTFAALAVGPARVSPGKVIDYLFTGRTAGDPVSVVFWTIRVPRVALALLVGAALALAGACLQGLLLNPLADPYVTGVSSGAALGATIAIFARLPDIPWLMIFAMAGGLLTLFAVYGIATRRGKMNIYRLLLAGVTLSYLFFAVQAVLLIRSGNDVHRVIYWLLGSFNGRGWGEVKIALLILPLLVIPFFFSDELDILLQGEERALELGVEVERVKRVLFVVAALLTAISVSVSGIIGFVGLVVPHLARLVLGPGHRRMLALSILFGSSVMVLSDLVARTAFAPSEIPVGVVTVFFGAPFFLFLLRRRPG